ncbi:MAG: hypothetical protein AAB769_01140 [Patescibacteria group bacterium]
MNTLFLLVAAIAVPMAVSAYAAPKDLRGITDIVKNIVGIIVPILFLASLAGFLFGVGKFILSADSEEGRESGKKMMFWGVVAFFVMASIWSILSIAKYTFSL